VQVTRRQSGLLTIDLGARAGGDPLTLPLLETLLFEPVATQTLRPELARLQRQLDTVSELVMIVVNHLPSSIVPPDQS
jgi:hypothetical protein